MENELYRMSTFPNWPGNSQSSISPILLAKNGFYYSGVGDKVTCYKCKVELDNWTSNDDVTERHRTQSPSCQLVNGNREDTNRQGTAQLGNPGITNAGSSNASTGIGFNLVEGVFNSAVSRTTARNLYITNAEHQIDRSSPDFDKLKDEEIRLCTFFDWPQDAYVDPQDLAREGFFYTGKEDRVQCAFCQGFIRKWKPTDVPSVEHKKHFPQCSFIRGLEIGNVRKMMEMSGARFYQDSIATRTPQSTVPLMGLESRQPLVKEQAHSLAQSDSQISAELKYPRHSSLSSRIDSFKNGIVPLGQTANILAEAGFFYIGPGDKVLCYHCGGNLKDWQSGDDPWDQHRRWYEYCPHLKNLTPAAREPLVPQRMPMRLDAFRIEPREIKARMDTATVRAILDMGYQRDLVQKAIEIRLRTTGDDFPNAGSLLDAIFDIEEEGSLQASVSSISGRPIASSSPLAQRTETATASSSNSSASSERLWQFPDSISTAPSQMPSSSVPPSSTYAPLPAAIVPATTQEESAAGFVASGSNQLMTESASKSKGKRKKNKKRKAANAPSGEEEVEENQTRDNVDQEIPTGDAEMRSEDRETPEFVEENRRLREARTCKQCMAAEVNIVFLPCGHLVCCDVCSPDLRICPICRTLIKGTVKTFLS